jgi:hypothetical protein
MLTGTLQPPVRTVCTVRLLNVNQTLRERALQIPPDMCEVREIEQLVCPRFDPPRD